MWALLIVDPQVDFTPGGALPVPGGDAIFTAINNIARTAPIVVASRDWHPADHVSFQQRGGPWPPHCVRGTRGAKFHPNLDASQITKVVSKGFDRDHDAYSAFEETDLAHWLRVHRVDTLVVAGLATDYCVKATVLDALREGFRVTVVTDGIAAVNVHPDDDFAAIHEMADRGARITTLLKETPHA